MGMVERRRLAGEAMTSPSFSEFTRVILPLDGTPESAAALPVARQLAEVAGATLHIMHVAERVFSGAELLRALGVSEESIGSAVLEGMTGQPAECILRAATPDRSLIVMTMRAAHAGSEIGLGSVAEDVLRGCCTPVLLMPPEKDYTHWRLRNVLLPHDGSPASAAVIAPAIALTHRAHAALWVIHVAAPQGPVLSESGAMDMPRYIDQPQHEWPAWSQEFLERLEALCCGLQDPRVHLQLAVGDPETEIARAARAHEADLVVLAWHGSFAGKRARIVKALLREAPCPILILPFGRGA